MPAPFQFFLEYFCCCRKLQRFSATTLPPHLVANRRTDTMGRALHDEMLRSTSAATVKEALREHAARKPTFMERYGMTWLLRMLFTTALGIYEFLCGWRDLYSKQEVPPTVVARMLEANKVIGSPPQATAATTTAATEVSYRTIPLHVNTTPHHILVSFSLQ